MKKIKLFKLIFIVALISLITSCTPVEEECTAIPYGSFQYLMTTGGPNDYTELPVRFKNYIYNAYEYNWDFGDGKTSTLSEPTHTYLQNGIYTITLTATGSCGSITQSQEITINFGQVVFYISNSNYGSISVYPNTQVLNWQCCPGNITTWYETGIPDCWASNCFTYTLEAGTYTYKAESCYGDAFTSQYQVVAGECKKIRIF